MQLIGTTPFPSEDGWARLYRFAPLVRTLAARAFPAGKGAVLSFFAKSLSGAAVLRLEVIGPHSSQTLDIKVEEEWKRYHITLANEISVQPLELYIQSRAAWRTATDIGINFFQCEEGLFPSIPFGTDVVLPAISDGSPGVYRPAQEISIDISDSELSTSSGSFSIAATPEFQPGELFSDQVCGFFSLLSADDALEINCCVHGGMDSHLVVRIKHGPNIEIHDTGVIIGKQQYFLSLSFNRGVATLFLNSAVLIDFAVPERVAFGKVYLSQSASPEIRPLNGTIQRFSAYPAPLSYLDTLRIYETFVESPNRHVLNYIGKHFTPRVSEELAAFIDETTSESAFITFVEQLEFSIPYIYESFAPNKAFTEEQIRDTVWLLLQANPLLRASRETYSRPGRTDLMIEIKPGAVVTGTDDDQTISRESPSRTFRIEFKIWGRDGYDEVPAQPIKYMMPEESVCALIMIDRRKRPDLESFRNIVSECASFSCLEIFESVDHLPNIPHFVSIHEDARSRRHRMVFNIHVAIQ